MNAAAEYAQKLAALEQLQLRDGRRERALGIAKLVVAGCVIASAVLLVRHFAFAILTSGLALVFIILAVLHEKLLNAIRMRGRVVDFYQCGQARLEDRWAGRGETGERFLDAAHPYARDLDIFGDASLFQYLSAARTRAGEETLAKWLLNPAAPEEILARQTAVHELATRLDLRERLWSAGETIRDGVQPEALAAWGEAGPILTTFATRFLTTTLGLLLLLTIPAWIIWGTYVPLVLMSVLNAAYKHLIQLRLERAAEFIEKTGAELRLLAEVLSLLENESFTAPALRNLKATIRHGNTLPSADIRSLASTAETIATREGLLARPVDAVTFWSAQFVFRAEAWQRKHGPAIRSWIDAVGQLEALASLATFSYEHPSYTFAEILPGPACIQAEDIAHPLLSSSSAVGNDIDLAPGQQMMILSGPNMAGKSTFIRCLGVNAVLAQCGAPVRARRLRMSPLRIAASICVLDSLSGGVSRFYAEIRRLKLIADLAGGGMPVLFLLDELLSGTNSHDRLIGTEFVLKSLAERDAIGIVSTHDLALTQIAAEMPDRAFNAHFEDHIEGDRLIFDYKLKPGIVQTSNALRLMRAIGLGVNEPSA